MRKGMVITWIVGLSLSVIALMTPVVLAQTKASSDSIQIALSTKSLAASDEGARAGSIWGTVVDANGPVSGATVRVQTTQNSTLSAKDGTFALSGLSDGGPITITAWAAGYYNGVAITSVSASPITITLSPHYTTDNYKYDWYVLNGVKGSNACGTCHTNFKEWQADAHGQSATNSRFLSMYAGTDVHGNKSPAPTKNSLGIPLPPDLTKPYYGPGFTLDFPNRAGNCATCHTPIAAKTPNNKNCAWAGCHASTTSQNSYGVLDPGVFPMPLTGNAAEGISCEFCHKVGGVTINKKTHLPYEDSPGILSISLNRPTDGEDIFFGPLDDVIGKNAARIKDSNLPLFKQSEFCASCHYGVMGGVVGKMEVTGGVLVYNSYGEWLDSPYSNPATGKTCQDCHMPAMKSGYIAYPEQGGVYRDGSQIHSHQMVGASDPQLLQNSVTLSATTNILNGWLWVDVNIVNDRVGHDVPTDSPLRQMLLVVEVKDATGRSLPLALGSQLPVWAGDLSGKPGKAFAKVLQDEWTGEVPTGAIWRPIKVVSDTRIPALKNDFSIYSFPVQDDKAVTVEVRLIYRRAFQQLEQQKGWTDPDILMAQRTIQVPSAKTNAANTKIATSADQP